MRVKAWNAAYFARTFRCPESSVRVSIGPNVRAVKATIPQPKIQGTFGDADLHGGQQYAPLLELEISPRKWTRLYSVMALIRAATSAVDGSDTPPWRARSLAMSPSTLILPAMNACMPAWGLPSMRMALAMS